MKNNNTIVRTNSQIVNYVETHFLLGLSLSIVLTQDEIDSELGYGR